MLNEVAEEVGISPLRFRNEISGDMPFYASSCELQCEPYSGVKASPSATKEGAGNWAKLGVILLSFMLLGQFVGVAGFAIEKAGKRPQACETLTLDECVAYARGGLR